MPVGQLKLADLRKSSKIHGPADFGLEEFSRQISKTWVIDLMLEVDHNTTRPWTLVWNHF
jgi:hypothetical protein